MKQSVCVTEIYIYGAKRLERRYAWMLVRKVALSALIWRITMVTRVIIEPYSALSLCNMEF